MTLLDNIKPQEKGDEMGSLLRSVKKRKKSRRLGEDIFRSFAMLSSEN
jgi:hypothetical protein